ncbi:hypothetical protein [Ruminococcus gauvreauii]|uniref:DUF4367 domain-containing protein n=1 Tax=Ruminococcus gauvreauii TaxID=438033 RepID=A0ABY5VJW0_9FIRM|nr:hypothetical protein [Ruminococcus gauvreauii]UWP60627.1 hypothetical protein NQ502_06240 [Ruminococcus gauvreauii]
MGESRCLLCEGRIVNGRCEDCGMNYNRRRTYRLNGSGGYTVTVQKEKAAGNKKPPSAQAVNAQRTESTQRRTKEMYGNRASYPYHKEQTAKKRNFGGIVVAVIVAVGVISSAGEWIYDKVSEIQSGRAETAAVWETNTGDEEYVYDPYEYVTEVLPEGGESMTAVLQPGVYIGGSQLPVGQYSVKAVEGLGNVTLEDTDLMICRLETLWSEEVAAYDEYQEEYPYETETTADDFRLFEGWALKVQPGMAVEVSSENAQTASQKVPQKNAQDHSVVLEDGMEAGVDFPAGDYNLTVVSDYGSVVVKRGDYEVFHSFLEAGQLTGEYRNLVLKEGDQIIIEEDYTGEGFEVHLDACEKIYPE